MKSAIAWVRKRRPFASLAGLFSGANGLASLQKYQFAEPALCTGQSIAIRRSVRMVVAVRRSRRTTATTWEQQLLDGKINRQNCHEQAAEHRGSLILSKLTRRLAWAALVREPFRDQARAGAAGRRPRGHT
jgi:hypothetical protein